MTRAEAEAYMRTFRRSYPPGSTLSLQEQNGQTRMMLAGPAKWMPAKRGALSRVVNLEVASDMSLRADAASLISTWAAQEFLGNNPAGTSPMIDPLTMESWSGGARCIDGG